MAERITLEVAAEGVAVAWVAAEGCRLEPSGAFLEELLAEELPPADSPRKGAIRALLKHGSYRATGRGKPASEYLRQNADRGAFPRINNLVDIANVVSLQSQLPISLVDLDRAGSGSFLVRHGQEDETYVFNPAGQELRLRDLLLTATLPEDAPCATPVKDCQRTKTDEGTTRVLGLVYAPLALAAEARAAAERMAELLARHCDATTTTGLSPRDGP